jgi:hypothetical protein
MPAGEPVQSWKSKTQLEVQEPGGPFESKF